MNYKLHNKTVQTILSTKLNFYELLFEKIRINWVVIYCKGADRKEDGIVDRQYNPP